MGLAPRIATAGLAGLLVLPAIALGASCGGAFTAATAGSDAGDAAADVAIDVPGDTLPGPDALQPPPSHCAGAFTCVPAVPAGWVGAVELYAGPSASPPCDTGFGGPADSTDGFNAPPPTCGCQCGGPQAVFCPPPPISIYGNAACAGALCTTTTPAPGACVTISDATCVTAPTGMGVSCATPPASGGNCPPIPTTSVPKATWSVNARACASVVAPEQVDCPSGSTCAPQPGALFLPTLCIAKPGDVQCPAGAYSSRHLYYAGLDDTRGCTPCTCGDVTGAVCQTTIDSYQSTDHSCSGGHDSFFAPLTCGPMNVASDIRVTLTASGGSCSPVAVSAQGSATPMNPLTYCCVP